MAGRARPWVIGLSCLAVVGTGLLFLLENPPPARKPALAPVPEVPPGTPPAFPKERQATPVPKTLTETAIIAERQAIYLRLTKRPPLELLKRWFEEAAREPGDANLRAVLPAAFVASLSAASAAQSEPLASSLAEALLDEKSAPPTRFELAYALAASGTLSGVQALLQAATAPAAGPELHAKIAEAIAWLGQEGLESGLSPADLSPTLESGLMAAVQAQDRPLALAIGRALAQLGTASGVQAAFELALTQPGSPDEAGLGLQDALAHTTNAAAIAYLASNLTGPAGDPRRVELSGLALISIGSAEAVQPVLEWLRAAPEEAEPLVREWFRNVHTISAQTLAERALREEAFEIPAIRTALEAQLAANRAAR